MRGLLILGCIAVGILLVAASHQDRAESGIEAKNDQGDFVNDRAIRSTGDEDKKKTKPPRKPGMFSAMGKPSKTLEKRSIEESPPEQRKLKKCRGCYTSLITQVELRLAPTMVVPQLRDTEEHEKLKKKQKHLKEKSKSKRRRNKDHKEKHAHFQREESEISHNDKRRKHHRGKKDRGHHRTGGFSAIESATLDMKKMGMDKHDTKDITE